MKKMIKIMAMAVTVLLCVQCGKEKGDETVVDYRSPMHLIYYNNCSTKINMTAYSADWKGDKPTVVIIGNWDIPAGEEKIFKRSTGVGGYDLPLGDSVIVSNGTQEITYRNSYYNPETIYNPEEYHEHEITEDENGKKIWVCTYIFTDEMFEEEN